MLAAAQRLRRSSDFAAAVRGGRRSGRGTVVVHLLIDEPAQASSARAGFVVSKAVGNAVNETVVFAFMALFVVNVVVTAIGIQMTSK